MSTDVAVLRERFVSHSEVSNYDVGPGYNVEVIGAAGRKTDTELPTKSLYSSAYVTTSPFSKVARAIQSLCTGSSTYMYGLVDELADYDIVHTLETFQGFSKQAVEAKREHGCSVVCTVFENIPHYSEPGHYSRTWKDVLKHKDANQIKQSVRENTDVFIAQSDRSKTALEIEGVDSSKIETIPIGVDTEKFSPETTVSTKIKTEMQSDRFDCTVVYVGQLIWEKGVFDLLAAWELLEQRYGLNANLVFVGDGRDRSDLEVAVENSAASSVSIVGRVPYDSVPEVFTEADITVLPSLPTIHWQEQLGRVIMESQACETPVLASQSGAIPFTMNRFGVTAQPGDPKDWAEKLADLLRDDARRADLGNQSREFVEANRNRDVTRERVRDVYDSLR